MFDEVKEYLRIDDTDSNSTIASLIMAADIYLVNAGATKDHLNPLYVLAVKMLALHWYDNREAIGSANKLAFGLGSIINQLKYCYPTAVI